MKDFLENSSTTHTFGVTEVQNLAHEIPSYILRIDMDEKYVLHIRASFVIAEHVYETSRSTDHVEGRSAKNSCPHQ